MARWSESGPGQRRRLRSVASRQPLWWNMIICLWPGAQAQANRLRLWRQLSNRTAQGPRALGDAKVQGEFPKIQLRYLPVPISPGPGQSILSHEVRGRARDEERRAQRGRFTEI
eukprot:3136246-Alexandrium_andersonii.AAC.1